MLIDYFVTCDILHRLFMHFVAVFWDFSAVTEYILIFDNTAESSPVLLVFLQIWARHGFFKLYELYAVRPLLTLFHYSILLSYQGFIQRRANSLLRCTPHGLRKCSVRRVTRPNECWQMLSRPARHPPLALFTCSHRRMQYIILNVK
jgi:hypothetical protein